MAGFVANVDFNPFCGEMSLARCERVEVLAKAA